MKTKLILLTAVMVYAACAYSQSSHYYYKGEKIPIQEDARRATLVTLKGNVDENAKMANSNKQKGYSESAFDYSVLELTKPTTEPLNVMESVTSLKQSIQKEQFTLPRYITESGKELVLTPYLYVKLKQEEDFEVLQSVASQYQLQIVRQDIYMPLWYTLAITSTTGMNTLEAANVIHESGLFAFSSPDFWSEAYSCTNDPNFRNQWGLYNSTYQQIDISACPAWNLATGRGVTIAIIDCGVDKNHPDLAPNIHSRSYDTGDSTGERPSQLYAEHGTLCAGIAAAAWYNGKFIAGVAPEAQIMDVSINFDSLSAFTERLASGINWAWQNDADVISCSWNTSYQSPYLLDAINDALTKGRNGKGCIVVFSAGNHNPETTLKGPVLYPANANPDVLVVGSIDQNGARSDFSAVGNALDVVAPGRGIISTFPHNSISSLDGTSMACPHVSGIAALILERNPNLTRKQVTDIIEKSTNKVGALSYDINGLNGSWNSEYGYGLVNALAAVDITPRGEINKNEAFISMDVGNKENRIKSVYPNPATSLVKIQFELENLQHAQLAIHSLDGLGIRTITELSTGVQEVTMDLSAYPKGVYAVSLINGGVTVGTAKLIKK